MSCISVRGRLRCEIAAATERIVFDQKSLLRGTSRRRGGVTVRIRDVHCETVDNQRPNCEIGLSSVTIRQVRRLNRIEPGFSIIRHTLNEIGVKTNFIDFNVTRQTDGAIAVDYTGSP